jgi:hypothetical protein
MIGFNPNQVYKLEDLVFYFPKHRAITPFLLLKDSYNNYDVLKLARNGMDKNYFIYSVSTASNISIEQSQCSMEVLTLEKDVFKTSPSTLMNFDFTNFKFAVQTSVLEEISKTLANNYRQIDELTKMNIEIYQAIEEASKL